MAERAIAEYGPHESIVPARRHIPGYVGSVPDDLVLRAAHVAGGVGRGPATAIPIGRGTGVGGATMIDIAFAIGELNGASLAIGDGSDRAPPSHRSTAAPGSPRALWLPDPDDVDRDGALDEQVGTGLARAAHALLVRLAERREALVRWIGELPTVFSHGDPTPGNVGSVGGRRVLLDWASSGRAPVGTDLAQLLQAPNRLIDARPRLLAECLAAYGGGLRRSAGTSAPEKGVSCERPGSTRRHGRRGRRRGDRGRVRRGCCA